MVFRIFRVNLESECPFWRSQGSCISNKCAVGECASDEVPDEWRQCEHTFNVERDLHKNEVTMIDSYPRSTKTSEWMRIEEQDEGAVFVNLNKNSESMTFFNGSHIWDAIYKENCFSLDFENQCKEDKILFKLLSGVHSNINMHISQFDYDTKGNELPHNYERYYERVGKHSDRLKNMIFSYSFILNAVNHLSGKVGGFTYISASPSLNEEMKSKLNELIEKSTKTCQHPFQEKNLFEMMSEQQFINKIKPVFYNITRILDCVTCEKCTLHGKLQFTGMTAVMKIMFGLGNESNLTRNEMVGLINLLAKLSNSIKWYLGWLAYEEQRHFDKKVLYYSTIVFLVLLNILVFKSLVFVSHEPKVDENKKKD